MSETGDKSNKQGRVSGAVSSVQNGAVNVLGATGAFILAMFIVACAIGVPLAMVVIGAGNLDNCPVQDKIPIYLIVAGVMGLFMVPLSSICGACIKCLPDDSAIGSCLSFCSTTIFLLLSLLLFVWFILGNVWVFGKYEPEYDPWKSSYCDEATYKLAFWTIIATYIFPVISCFCYACFAKRSTYNEIE